MVENRSHQQSFGHPKKATKAIVHHAPRYRIGFIVVNLIIKPTQPSTESQAQKAHPNIMN